MESIKNYVRYDSTYMILICCQHKYAIPRGKAINRHFQRVHSEMSMETRQKIWNTVKDLELADVNDVPIPLEDEYPIESIEVKEGYRCCDQSCKGYYAGEEGTMREHCKTKHNWRKNDPVCWTNQPVQTIFSGNLFFGSANKNRPQRTLLSNNFTDGQRHECHDGVDKWYEVPIYHIDCRFHTSCGRS